MKMVLNNNQISGKEDKKALHRILDKGIDDMEKGRELTLNDAFVKVSELRNNNGREYLLI